MNEDTAKTDDNEDALMMTRWSPPASLKIYEDDVDDAIGDGDNDENFFCLDTMMKK